MDRLPRPDRRRGTSGGILDRADFGSVITAGTVALRNGYDPIKLLQAEGIEKQVMELILNEADQNRLDDEEKRMKRFQIAVHNGVASAMGTAK